MDKVTGFEKLPDDLINTLFQILDENQRLSDVAYEKLLNPNTTHLKFHKLSTPSPNAGKFILRCQKLQNFSSSIPLATDEFLTSFTSECRNVRVLDLSHCCLLNESSLCTIANLSNLRELSMSGIPFATSPVIQKILQNCKELQKLDLSNSLGFDDSFDVRNMCPLKQLILANCHQLSVRGLKSISKNFQSLQKLSLAKCGQLNADALRALESCTSLQNLNLQLCTSLNDDTLLRLLKSLTLLRCLNIGGCTNVGRLSPVLWQTHSHLQNLKKMKMCGIGASVEELSLFLKHCSSLQVLDIAGCHKLKESESATRSLLAEFALQRVRMPSDICEIKVVPRATQTSPAELAWKGAPVAALMNGSFQLVAEGQMTHLQCVHQKPSPSGTIAFFGQQCAPGSYQVALFDQDGQQLLSRSNTIEIVADEEVWLAVSPVQVSASATITVRWRVKQAATSDWIACYSGQSAIGHSYLHAPWYQYNSAASRTGEISVCFSFFCLSSFNTYILMIVSSSCSDRSLSFQISSQQCNQLSLFPKY